LAPFDPDFGSELVKGSPWLFSIKTRGNVVKNMVKNTHKTTSEIMKLGQIGNNNIRHDQT
jgi:hypothetical protein